MNIINIEHISKIYGEKMIFDDASFGIQEGDRIGIVGINGTGKSTLLKMIAGEATPDSGQIIRQNGLKIAYVPQNPVFPDDADIRSFAFDRGDGEDWQVESCLTELGIREYDTPIAHLSGGQKRRVVLAKVLAQDFDVLLLDEPTNHLDGGMITWLEEYLRSCRSTILMVTHDRYFLDRVTNKILEISHGKIYMYEAKYSRFLELKAEREEMEAASWRKRNSILRMEMEWAKRGCRARSTKQRARLERLEALKNAAGPAADQKVEIDSVETRMGKKTIELHHIFKSFGEKVCIRDFDYIVLKNQRLGIIGPNGCGKSTLLKIIAGITEPDSGSVELGETIKIGYFSQEPEEMNTSQRVIDYIKDVAEYIPTKDGLISASKLLEQFLFDSSMQYSPIEKLSGGEKKRLHLLKVLAAAPNVLLLDEITNDIDIPTLTILEDYLDSFAGIVIAVSHDRYFLDNLADRIFAFEGDGRLVQYEGGYTDYLAARERKNTEENISLSGEMKKTAPAEELKEKDSVKTWKQNRPQKLKFSFKEQREYETIDDDITKLEQKLADLDREILANATNSGRLNELTGEREETQALLDEKTERWVYLTELAEKIEAQKQG